MFPVVGFAPWQSRHVDQYFLSEEEVRDCDCVATSLCPGTFRGLAYVRWYVDLLAFEPHRSDCGVSGVLLVCSRSLFDAISHHSQALWLLKRLID